MKSILIILLFVDGSLKAQISSPASSTIPASLPLFLIPGADSHYDSLAISRYAIDGKQALTLSRKGESIHCICQSKDDIGTVPTAILWKRESPLACFWPYTRLDKDKLTK